MSSLVDLVSFIVYFPIVYNIEEGQHLMDKHNCRVKAHHRDRAHPQTLHQLRQRSQEHTAHTLQLTSLNKKDQTKEHRGCKTRRKLCRREHHEDRISTVTSATQPSRDAHCGVQCGVIKKNMTSKRRHRLIQDHESSPRIT